jgi:FkbM family methyltransferase
MLLARHRSAELSSRPLQGVRVFLRASERIERLMWAGAYERDLVELFKRSVRPGMTVLDVGANIGYFSTIAAGMVGSHGRVHSFEPVPSCFARLERNLSQFGWAWAHRSAVGDKSGVATVHFKESESGWGSLFSDGSPDSATEVPVVTLDEWVDQQGIERLDFIKIDVEGGEFRALKGTDHILRKFRPMITAELNELCLQRDHHTPLDVLELLEAADYESFSFNDGVLAIPREAREQLHHLRGFTKRPFGKALLAP